MEETEGMKRIRQVQNSLAGPITGYVESIKNSRRAIAEIEAIPLTTWEERMEAQDFIRGLHLVIFRMELELENSTQTEEKQIAELQQSLASFNAMFDNRP